MVDTEPARWGSLRGDELVAGDSSRKADLVLHGGNVLGHPDGQKETVVTPWLIGCDGAHSAVRHGLNVEFHGSTQGDEGLIAWRDAQLPDDQFPDWLTDRIARRPAGMF